MFLIERLQSKSLNFSMLLKSFLSYFPLSDSLLIVSSKLVNFVGKYCFLFTCAKLAINMVIWCNFYPFLNSNNVNYTLQQGNYLQLRNAKSPCSYRAIYFLMMSVQGQVWRAFRLPFDAAVQMRVLIKHSDLSGIMPSKVALLTNVKQYIIKTTITGILI